MTTLTVFCHGTCSDREGSAFKKKKSSLSTGFFSKLSWLSGKNQNKFNLQAAGYSGIIPLNKLSAEEMVSTLRQCTDAVELSRYYAEPSYSSMTRNLLSHPQTQFSLELDGPGSLSDSRQQVHSRPGTFDPTNVTKSQRQTLYCSDLRGALGGKGWDENVQYAINIIHETFTKHCSLLGNTHKLETINLVGWSRGGITTVKLANALAEDPRMQNIPVHIFAIDPVNGPTRKNEIRHRRLPKNVKYFKAIIASTASLPGFDPLHRSQLQVDDYTQTKVDYLILPANHSTVVRVERENDIGRIVFENAARFLTEFDTKFDRDQQKVFKPLSDTKLICLYMQLMFNGHCFEQGHKFRRNLSEYNFMPSTKQFFLNSQHFSLFAKEYPIMVQYLHDYADVAGNMAKLSFQSEKLWWETEKLKIFNPITYAHLLKVLPQFPAMPTRHFGKKNMVG